MNYGDLRVVCDDFTLLNARRILAQLNLMLLGCLHFIFHRFELRISWSSLRVILRRLERIHIVRRDHMLSCDPALVPRDFQIEIVFCPLKIKNHHSRIIFIY